MPKEIWCADCETDPFDGKIIPQPFIWGIYNGSEYHEFTDTDEFVNFCKEIDGIIYAHNGGKFDWLYITEHFEPWEPLMLISGRLSKFKIGNAEFRDSWNILPQPLRAFCKDDFDYTLLKKEHRHKPENWKKIQQYLASDCRNLWNVVNDYIERYGVNLTQAGTAMKMWRKITGEKAPKTSRDFYDQLAPYYYGGRVQCFKPGIKDYNFTVVDINSAYPHAMKHLHPYGDNFVVTDKLPKTEAMIQRCFIQLECVSRGAFPYREKTGLAFPADNDVRKYHITGWEYLAALDTGTISNVTIISVIQFPDSIRFDDYVDHFFAMKNEAKETGDNAGYQFAKLFLNSLYGKFGANPDKYNEYTVVKSEHIYHAEQEDDYNFCAELPGNLAIMTKPLDEARQTYYNVAVAASITGFVRAYMWESINKCKGVIYCDTDSIFCRSTGDLELDPAKLGAWDIEAKCDYGAFGGKKLYAARCTKKWLDANEGAKEWKTASKGVKLTPEQLIKVAKGETVVYNPEAPSYSLKRGIRFVPRKIQMIT